VRCGSAATHWRWSAIDVHRLLLLLTCGRDSSGGSCVMKTWPVLAYSDRQRTFVRVSTRARNNSVNFVAFVDVLSKPSSSHSNDSSVAFDIPARAVRQGAGAEEEVDRERLRRLEQEGLPRVRRRHGAPRPVRRKRNGRPFFLLLLFSSVVPRFGCLLASHSPVLVVAPPFGL